MRLGEGCSSSIRFESLNVLPLFSKPEDLLSCSAALCCYNELWQHIAVPRNNLRSLPGEAHAFSVLQKKKKHHKNPTHSPSTHDEAWL